MNLLDQFRTVADRLRGVSITEQKWIGIDCVRDTGRLLRAIEAVMPRDATLNVMRPCGMDAEDALRRHAMRESRPEEGDYLIAIGGAGIVELARLADRIAPAPLCAGIFVVQGERNLLESFRRDAGEDVVWLSADMDQKLIGRLQQALTTIVSHAETLGSVEPGLSTA